MQINSPKYGIIELIPEVPRNFNRLLLPGSNPFFCQREFGTILIQEVTASNYWFRYSIFNILEKIALLFVDESTGTRIRLATKNELNIEKPGEEKIFVKEGEYILLGGIESQETIWFEEGKEYRFFDANYSALGLSGLLEQFPSLIDFITNTGSPTPLLKKKSPRIASNKMIKIVHDLLKRPYSERLQRLYFQNKVNDYFFEILAQADWADGVNIRISKRQEDAIYKARDIILEDLTKHYTIRQLSQKVQLNESWLKSGFKKIFGTGIYEYLLDARMHEAMRLLTETDKPTKEIAALTGYGALTNFGVAFNRYFDATPGSFRKK